MSIPKKQEEATFPIREQVERGDWNFKLKAVYTVAILDFVFDADKDEPEKYRYDVTLTALYSDCLISLYVIKAYAIVFFR